MDKKEKLIFGNPGIYFITDSTLTRKNVIDDVKSAIKGGVKVIQYREKNYSKDKKLKECLEIRKLCSENHVLFLVNDDVDLAISCNADGVHLGKQDMAYETARKKLGYEKIIGLSANTETEALEMEKLGADYIGLGPIFETSTKKDAEAPVGTAVIKSLSLKLKIPLVVIGGINESNFEEILSAGARNIAMISSIVAKDDVEK